MIRRRFLMLAAVAVTTTAVLPSRADEPHKPIKLLIITGDDVGAHDWKATTPVFKEFLSKGGHIQVDVTETPAQDLTPENLAKHDYSGLRLTRHALERFVERFWTGELEAAEGVLRATLRRCRRLGRNPNNGAVAALALVGDRMLVAIVQDEACTTVLTWAQFEPRLAEFGRARLPRKKGRMLRRLRPAPGALEDPGAPLPEERDGRELT